VTAPGVGRGQRECGFYCIRRAYSGAHAVCAEHACKHTAHTPHPHPDVVPLALTHTRPLLPCADTRVPSPSTPVFPCCSGSAPGPASPPCVCMPSPLPSGRRPLQQPL
jgi:hypothetical protein